MNIRIIEIDNIEAARKAVAQTGADPYSLGIMAPKAVFRTLMLDGADNRAAALLKQEMLALGGEAAVSEKVSRFEKGYSKVLLMGTLKVYRLLVKKLSGQPFGLKSISKEIESALSNKFKTILPLGRGRFKLAFGGRTLVMGVLNATPDSFSDGGRYAGVESAVERALEMEREGADIIDIGGESSRPGAARVPEKEELRRIIPVIKKTAGKLKIPVSVDTYKPAVALAALDAGACIINDITALRYGGRELARAVSSRGAGVILMHMLGNPRTMQASPAYKDVINDILAFFEDRTAFAEECGIPRQRVMIDPGIGFGKTVEHNFEILKNLRSFKSPGFPVVAGVSRKSFIGKTLDGIPAGERLSGSLSAGLWAARNGADILRVHDVKETVQALKIYQRIADSV